MDPKSEMARLQALVAAGLMTAEELEVERRRLLTVALEAAPSLHGPTAVAPPAVPKRVGPYVVVGPLGAGAMGIVLRARHGEAGWARRQGGEVALKLMHPHLAGNPALRERFLDEAAAGLRLDHPGLVRVFEVVADGPWLGMAMGLVEGPTLEAWADEVGLPVPLPVALGILRPLADALDNLHSRGVVHRDLKPANVKLRADGQPVLLDLGVARDAARPSENLTAVEMAVGTRPWMAPEQEQGKDCSPRSDVYALGLVAYWLLAGRMPWPAKAADATVSVNKALNKLLPLAEGHGAAVVGAVMGALAAQVEARPAGCGELVAQIAEAAAQDAATARLADFTAAEAARGQMGPYEGFAVGEEQLVMRRIGPQRFGMGVEADGDSLIYWLPLQTVTLTRGYSIGVFPVTQGQYAAVMKENPSYFREVGDAARRPVEQVSWFDAVRFCNKLSGLVGLKAAYTIGSGDAPTVTCDWGAPGFRLPTEAEWECAARAGTGHAMGWSGSNEAGEVAWTNKNGGSGPPPVGMLRPNAWDLFDLSGNVWEWVWDLWESEYAWEYSEELVVDPRGPVAGSPRVLRGGSWDDAPACARVAFRNLDFPGSPGSYLGFRLARTIP